MTEQLAFMHILPTTCRYLGESRKQKKVLSWARKFEIHPSFITVKSKDRVYAENSTM